jgi:hypothetical protein
MQRGIRTTLLGAASILGALTSAGCESAGGCGEFFPPASQVTLTLHLPPGHDVAMPEIVKVCEDVKCAMGTVPPVGGGGAGSFEFTPPATEHGTVMSTAPVAPSIANGDLSVVAGGVRLLRILWPLVKDSAFNPGSPSGIYLVDVRDASGAQTGKLTSTIVYAHVTRCGADAWTGAASD